VFDLPDSIGNGLGLAGCAPWSPLGPDAMLVVKAVGLRDLDADGATPMLTAVMDDLRSRKGRPKVESAHFVFVATAEVKVQADALVA